MSQLRVDGLCIAGALLAALASCGGRAGAPASEFVRVTLAGHEFRVPLEHVPGDIPVSAGAASDSSDGEFVAQFSAGWLAMHIAAYQPVTNDSLLGVAAYVKVVGAGETLPPVLPLIADEAWYGRGTFAERVIDGERDPHTGLFIIKAGPVPPGSESWLGLLAASLPVAGAARPPDWYVLTCNHAQPALIPRASSVTRCYVNGHAAADIFISVNIAGENLRIRDEVVDTIGRTVASWRVTPTGGKR